MQMPQNTLFWLSLATIASVWIVGVTIARRLDLPLNDIAERDVHARLEVDGRNELTDMDLAMLDPEHIQQHERRIRFERIRYGYMPPIDDRGWPCWMAWKDWEARSNLKLSAVLEGRARPGESLNMLPRGFG
jgi:hypothetical protein